MIALPIVNWTLGDPALTYGIILSVLLQTAAVLSELLRHWSHSKVLTTVLIVAMVTWLVEAIGTATGVPFGVYDYTAKLQPQLAHVPLLIPLAWLMMLPPAWAVASRLVGRFRGPAFIALSALAMVAWDLFLDPQMVNWGLWEWQNGGAYFGIPLSNYLGWFLTAALVTLLIEWIVKPESFLTKPFILIYATTWVLQSIGVAILWGMPGPAFFGFLGMGCLLLLPVLRGGKVQA
ncbi:MAG: carotenoid biosynthesis protein [Chloroflexi bacterium]|nr:carotenoid biosynthesis protein [Chloroflexota bacterium]